MTERNTEVGTNGGLSQRWRAQDDTHGGECMNAEPCCHGLCAGELDAAKLHIEEAVKALEAHLLLTDDGGMVFHVERMAVLKIIREIL